MSNRWGHSEEATGHIRNDGAGTVQGIEECLRSTRVVTLHPSQVCMRACVCNNNYYYANAFILAVATCTLVYAYYKSTMVFKICSINYNYKVCACVGHMANCKSVRAGWPRHREVLRGALYMNQGAAGAAAPARLPQRQFQFHALALQGHSAHWCSESLAANPRHPLCTCSAADHDNNTAIGMVS